jgi:hypothetical protein
MNLYRIYTRQTEAVDLQYFSIYHVWAPNRMQAEVDFLRHFKHAFIRDVEVCGAGDAPMILLQCG